MYVRELIVRLSRTLSVFHQLKPCLKPHPHYVLIYGSCKARFSRDTYTKTGVDPKTRALNMKKGEAWINTVTPVLTYLLRSNSDVTSLLLGTAIKSVVAYVTEYITKTPLKMHVMFETIRKVFNNNAEMIGGSLDRRQKARMLLTQIVNVFTAQSEIGGPMAAMYLLKHNDHYISHKFKVCYWRSYVHEVLKAWKSDDNTETVNDIQEGIMPEKVMLGNVKEQPVALSPVMDYVHRPQDYESMSLYQWIQLAVKDRKPSERCKSAKSDNAKTQQEPQWEVNRITDHQWHGQRVDFYVQWKLGDCTWEPYSECKKLKALDNYLAKRGVDHWRKLPKTLNGVDDTIFSQTVLDSEEAVHPDVDIDHDNTSDFEDNSELCDLPAKQAAKASNETESKFGSPAVRNTSCETVKRKPSKSSQLCRRLSAKAR